MPFSLRMWKLAAKQKNVAANIRAGDVYFYGLQGIPVDFEQAARMATAAVTLNPPCAWFESIRYRYALCTENPSEITLPLKMPTYPSGLSVGPSDVAVLWPSSAKATNFCVLRAPLYW